MSIKGLRLFWKPNTASLRSISFWLTGSSRCHFISRSTDQPLSVKKGEAFKPGGGDTPVVPPTGDPELLAPAAGMELQFGDVAIL